MGDIYTVHQAFSTRLVYYSLQYCSTYRQCRQSLSFAGTFTRLNGSPWLNRSNMLCTVSVIVLLYTVWCSMTSASFVISIEYCIYTYVHSTVN